MVAMVTVMTMVAMMAVVTMVAVMSKNCHFRLREPDFSKPALKIYAFIAFSPATTAL
jgi:hypothetical protein